MAVFIELVTDAFDGLYGKGTDAQDRKTGIGKLMGVRRPTRGLEIKDETYAYLKVQPSNGDAIDLIDAGGLSDVVGQEGTTKEYSNFIIQQVTEARMERHQVVETFGDTYLFLFGEAPRFINVQAVLLNSHDFNWKAEFMENYDRYLRGTKSLEAGARTYLFYDSNVVEGYILNAQVIESSRTPLECNLSFQMFVTKHHNVSVTEGTGRFPVRSSALIPEGLDVRNPDDTFMFKFFAGEQIAPLSDPTISATYYYDLINRERVYPEPAPEPPEVAIRSLIRNNADEYIGGKDLINNNFDVGDGSSDVDDRNNAFGDAMSAYGVDPAYAYGPSAANGLGYGPAFAQAGIGVGASARASVGVSASFGASASASVGAFAGGFAGVKLSASAGAGFSSFASAGVSASASAGVFAGASAFAGAKAGASLGAGSSSLLGTNVGTSPFQTPNYAGSSYSTSRGGGRATAMVSLGVQANASAGASFSTGNVRSAALAGGYAGANNSLNYPGSTPNVVSSYAGAGGSAGAGVMVGGKPTAFAFTSSPGTLQNSNLPPGAAMQQAQPGWSWSKSRSWPHG